MICTLWLCIPEPFLPDIISRSCAQRFDRLCIAVLLDNSCSNILSQVSAATGTLEGTQWYRFDDERVYEVEASQALVENFGTGSAGHHRNMWNWQTIKYGRTACMLFYVRRSAAAGILASGSAAAAVQAAANAGTAAAAEVRDRNKGGAASVSPAQASSASVNNSNTATRSDSAMKNSVTSQSSSLDIWRDHDVPVNSASSLRDNCAQSLLRTDNYTDIRKALLQLNRPDALAAFQLHHIDDAAVDLAEHEQHLEYLGLTAQENALLMEIWQSLRGLGASTAPASRDLPIDIKLRSMAITPSSAAASLAPRSFISPDSATMPEFNNPSLSIRNITDIASSVCIKNSNERRMAFDSDDEYDTEHMTANNVQHLPPYIRAYHPRILSQLRVFNVSRLFCAFHVNFLCVSPIRLQYRLQHVTGPIEPIVTLAHLAPDASLILAWTVPSLTHVAVSVCVGTWGVGDPSPTYVGNPVVVYVQLSDEMRVVKTRAVEVSPLRSSQKSSVFF